VFENEVDYRIAKWILRNLHHMEVITQDEFLTAWRKVAEHYNSPFSELDEIGASPGKEVKPDGKCDED